MEQEGMNFFGTKHDMDFVMTPSDFVGLLNQTLEIAYPVVIIEGEISNFRVAKGKWLYFDIKDESASLRCFGTVYNLKLPIEDGMVVRLTARPELHPQYNFSLQVISIAPRGEGSIRKSFDLLKAKLEGEGLFDPNRKRILPYPPEKIGLITSSEAAAYGDFVKVLGARWPLVQIDLIDVRVQGDQAADEIVAAIHHFNQAASDIGVLIIVRGGGSADDLIAFQEEPLVRAIAESRIPTLVAIGHERDVSLAELAADKRASTPSNAAELLVPDRQDVLSGLNSNLEAVKNFISSELQSRLENLVLIREVLSHDVGNILISELHYLKEKRLLIDALNPANVLKRGFAIVRGKDSKIIRSSKLLKVSDDVTVIFEDGIREMNVVG